jgi:histidine triad (HIT) family protein
MVDARCVFCDIVAGVVPTHVVLDDDVAVAFLDRSPLFKGHVLVVPRVHRLTLADLEAPLVGPYFERVQRVAAAMHNIVRQSVPHLHTHVVPRRRKDGLRGFFWPRIRYASDAEAEDFATRIANVLSDVG